MRALNIRLLGDRVLQNFAWNFSERLGWEDTFTAEYVALTKLQVDAFVTLNPNLARAADTRVPTACVSACKFDPLGGVIGVQL